MALARRSFLFSALALSVMASGCGFHLRGQTTLPFETLYVDMPVNDKIAANIRRLIAASTNVTIVELVSSGRHRDVVSVNMQGEERDYELTLNMTFRLVDPDGNEFFPPTTFTASRTMYYNDDEYLSRTAQEEILYSEMQQNLINRLLARMSSVEPIVTDEY